MYLPHTHSLNSDMGSEFETVRSALKPDAGTGGSQPFAMFDPEMAHVDLTGAKPYSKSNALKTLILEYPIATCLSVYMSWTVLGIAFYHYYDQFSGPTAFFFAMEAGLSVGFCNPQEKDDTSKLFTIFYVLIGGSLIASMFGVVLFEATKITDGLHPNLMKRSKKWERELSITNTKNPFLRACNRIYQYSAMFLWDEDPSRAQALCLMILAVICGTVIASQDQDWTLISSLYWAVTTLSTAGLQSPYCEAGYAHTCNIPSITALTMGFFMMFGIPVYAVALGKVAQAALEYSNRQFHLRLLNTPITRGQLNFVSKAFSPSSGESLACSDYILLELMRCGFVKADDVCSLKKRVDELERRKVGYLKRADLMDAGVATNAKKRVR